MAFDLTREGVTPVSGMYAVIPNLPQDHNVIFYAEDETATIAAGYAVQLSSTSTNTAAPVVEATTALTDIPYGFVVYDALKDAYAVGGKIAVAKTGDVNSFFQMLNTVLRATKKKNGLPFPLLFRITCIEFFLVTGFTGIVKVIIVIASYILPSFHSLDRILH